MRHVVKLPKVGDTADEAVITGWYVSPGQPIAEGAPLLRVETDKVEVDIPCPLPGVLKEQLVEDGEDVTTGTPIAVLES